MYHLHLNKSVNSNCRVSCSLKELQNCKQIFSFVSTTKIGETVTNTLNCSFLKIRYTLGKSNLKSTWRKLKLLLLNLLFIWPFLLYKCNGDSFKQNILPRFYSLWKERTHKASSESNAKDFFSSVHVIGTSCFDERFLLHVINGWCFFQKNILFSEVFSIAMLLLSLT